MLERIRLAIRDWLMAPSALERAARIEHEARMAELRADTTPDDTGRSPAFQRGYAQMMASLERACLDTDDLN